VPEGETATAHGLAAIFTMMSWRAPSGPRHIGSHLVASWYDRRRATGFPEVAERIKAGPYRPVRAWSLLEALTWFLNWTPKERPLGAPKGNQNARKHGHYSKIKKEEGPQ
jgi:hypothetical protein